MPWRLSLKVQRTELLALLLASLAVSVAAGVATAVLHGIQMSSACLQLFDGRQYTASEMRSCDGASTFLAVNAWAGWIMAAMAVLPLLGGAVVGSQLVSREVDAGTAQWPWSLGLSRRRWLAQRLVPVALFVAAVTAVPAAMAWLLESARNPTVDAGSTFLDYGLRGPLVVGRALAALAVSLAIGAALGRSLPALLAASGASALGLALLVAGTGWGASLTAVPSRDLTNRSGYILISSGWLTSGGIVLSEDEARASSPNPADAEQTLTWLLANFQEVSLIIPGEQAQEVAAREMGVLALTSVAGVLVAAAVVDRRRPY
ncbi:MAG: hypothetical protein U0838_00770 [Chloroflexota bacterium]